MWRFSSGLKTKDKDCHTTPVYSMKKQVIAIHGRYIREAMLFLAELLRKTGVGRHSKSKRKGLRIFLETALAKRSGRRRALCQVQEL